MQDIHHTNKTKKKHNEHNTRRKKEKAKTKEDNETTKKLFRRVDQDINLWFPFQSNGIAIF